MQFRTDLTLDSFNERGKGHFPGLVGIKITDLGQGFMTSEMPVRPELLAPNTYLHAGSVVTLADTTAGYGCVAHLPEGAQSFTTIELKTNFLGTAREGTVTCKATLAHGGRTTQVWDVTVHHRETDKVIALFRCTQMILYPKI